MWHCVVVTAALFVAALSLATTAQAHVHATVSLDADTSCPLAHTRPLFAYTLARDAWVSGK
jgi:hypothetical protein